MYGCGTYSEEAYEALIAEILTQAPSFASVGAQAYSPGLERIERMCALLGGPQKKYRCIHVAGTNGKGSTCNLLAASLAATGLRVGLYTSPHILDFRERMRVVTMPPSQRDGIPPDCGKSGYRSDVTLISRSEVWDFFRRWKDTVLELQLSFFEITTALAFWYFARQKVDVAVIETGLGGRLDATNVITPQLSVITNIGYDHMDILGPTLAAIAFEKAGIIKQGVPVVIGERGAESDPVFEKAASDRKAPIVFAQDVCAYVPVPAGADLAGIYQVRNRCTATAALKALGMEADSDVLDHAAGICDFHGRWEKLQDKPFTIADIGHNAHGLRYNFRQLDAMLDSGEYSDLVMVYGSVADKDVDAVLALLPARAYIYFTAAGNRRAMRSDELMRRAGAVRGSVCGEPVPVVADAVALALARCESLARPLLYIGGSTYVVSEAVAAIRAM